MLNLFLFGGALPYESASSQGGRTFQRASILQGDRDSLAAQFPGSVDELISGFILTRHDIGVFSTSLTQRILSRGSVFLTGPLLRHLRCARHPGEASLME